MSSSRHPSSSFGSSLLSINIVSALNCEAKGIIDLFKLKKYSDKPFTTFKGDAEFTLEDNAVARVPITVLVSGIGALNMATAAGWLGAKLANNAGHAIWLNLGIAGHGRFDIGQGFIVGASHDVLSQRAYYPPQVARRPVALSPCMSLNTPSTDYPEEGAIDMEASAFFQAATKFSNAELVQSYKVVSDTPEQSFEGLNAKVIQDLMQPHTSKARDYLASLTSLADKLPVVVPKLTVPDVSATHSQKQQVNERAERLSCLLEPQGIGELNQQLIQLDSIDAVLALLTHSLQRAEPRLTVV